MTDEKKQEFHAECKEEKSKLEKMLSRYLIAVLDVIFFLYSNNKRVNTTLKMLTILDEIIIMLENPYLIKKNTINRFSDYIRDLVFKKIQDELSLVFQVSRLDENSQIETLYFLVVLKNRKRLGITVFQPRLKVCTFARTNYYEYGKQRQVQESP